MFTCVRTLVRTYGRTYVRTFMNVLSMFVNKKVLAK